MMVFVVVSVPLLKTPPPLAAELPEKVLPAIVTLPEPMKIAPPAVSSSAELPENVLCSMVTLPVPMVIAPPGAELFPLNVLLLIVRAPE
jgi:hypothetical protein